MVDKERLKKHLLAGKPTKYEEQKHVNLLIDIFTNGESIAAFCSEAFITKKTFFNWLEVHERFKQAYEVAVNIAERKWEGYPLEEGREINYQYWYMIMKNRFGYGKPRVQASEDKTPIGRISAIWKGAEAGDLTTDEISKLAGLAVAQANIESNGAMQSQAEHARLTYEERAEQIEKIERYLEEKKRENENNSNSE